MCAKKGKSSVDSFDLSASFDVAVQRHNLSKARVSLNFFGSFARHLHDINLNKLCPTAASTIGYHSDTLRRSGNVEDHETSPSLPSDATL